MSAAKKQKIYERTDNGWCSKYLVVSHNQSVVCHNTIAVTKEYNAKSHYTTKHSSQFDEIACQEREMGF